MIGGRQCKYCKYEFLLLLHSQLIDVWFSIIILATNLIFRACVAYYTETSAQPAVEQLSSDGSPSSHVPSLKIPAVTTVDLSEIPEGTLGEWLCKHTVMIFIGYNMISLIYRYW